MTYSGAVLVGSIIGSSIASAVIAVIFTIIFFKLVLKRSVGIGSSNSKFDSAHTAEEDLNAAGRKHPDREDEQEVKFDEFDQSNGSSKIEFARKQKNIKECSLLQNDETLVRRDPGSKLEFNVEQISNGSYVIKDLSTNQKLAHGLHNGQRIMSCVVGLQGLPKSLVTALLKSVCSNITHIIVKTKSSEEHEPTCEPIKNGVNKSYRSGSIIPSITVTDLTIEVPKGQSSSNKETTSAGLNGSADKSGDTSSKEKKKRKKKDKQDRNK